jgi:repressor LexA
LEDKAAANMQKNFPGKWNKCLHSESMCVIIIPYSRVVHWKQEVAMAELSKMQQRIYDFLASYIQSRGYPPSVREIGEAVGLKSPSTVHFHLKHLEEAGVIAKGAGKGRAITLMAQPMPEDKVPIVGNVAAGSPILAEECIEDYLTFDTGGRAGEYFALRVRGESMLNAGILPGDLVVVRRQETANNGEIVVAMIEDEATVKRLSRKNGRTWLLPENDAYSPIDGTYAQILGKVAAVVRRY